MSRIAWSTSSYLEPPICRAIRRSMHSIGAVDVGPVFLIPESSRSARFRGRTVDVRLRYARRASDRSGRTVYLRSHGADFNIVPPEWVVSGFTHVFSLGPGLDQDGVERTLLLDQSFVPGSGAETLRILEELGIDREAKCAVSPEYSAVCTRISALVPAEGLL